MALFLIVISLISMLLPQLFGKNLETYKKKYSDSQSDYTARTSEYIYGYDTIKGFGILNKVVSLFKYNCKNVFNKGIDYAKKFSFVQGLSIFLGGITFMGAFLFGGFLVTKKILTIGDMIICIQLSNHVTQPVYSAIEQLSSIKSVNKIIKK